MEDNDKPSSSAIPLEQQVTSVLENTKTDRRGFLKMFGKGAGLAAGAGVLASNETAASEAERFARGVESERLANLRNDPNARAMEALTSRENGVLENSTSLAEIYGDTAFVEEMVDNNSAFSMAIGTPDGTQVNPTFRIMTQEFANPLPLTVGRFQEDIIRISETQESQGLLARDLEQSYFVEVNGDIPEAWNEILEDKTVEPSDFSESGFYRFTKSEMKNALGIVKEKFPVTLGIQMDGESAFQINKISTDIDLNNTQTFENLRPLIDVGSLGIGIATEDAIAFRNVSVPVNGQLSEHGAFTHGSSFVSLVESRGDGKRKVECRSIIDLKAQGYTETTFTIDVREGEYQSPALAETYLFPENGESVYFSDQTPEVTGSDGSEHGFSELSYRGVALSLDNITKNKTYTANNLA